MKKNLFIKISLIFLGIIWLSIGLSYIAETHIIKLEYFGYITLSAITFVLGWIVEE